MVMNKILSPEDFYIFSEVAKYQNLSKVAQKLYISQSALSRRILLMEKKIGITLFERTPSGVKLTPGGKLILEQYSAIVDTYQTMVMNARLLNEGQIGLVKIGVQEGLVLDEDTLDFIRLFKSTNKGIQTEIQCFSHETLLNHIKTGNIDVGFINNYNLADLKDICHCDVCKALGYILLSADSKIADALSESLDYSLLSNETLLLYNSSIAQSSVDFVRTICRSCGFTPAETRLTSSYSTMILWVMLNMGFAIGYKNSWYGSPKIKYIPLPETAFCYQVAVWSNENHNLASQIFVSNLCRAKNKKFEYAKMK